MSLWKYILMLGANGKSDEARSMLALDLPQTLRQFDSSAHGEYRTKRVILEIYDEMKRTMETGAAYRTRLDPSPANGWTPPELPQEKAEEKSVVQAGMSDAKQRSDLFLWQAEEPQ